METRTRSATIALACGYGRTHLARTLSGPVLALLPVASVALLVAVAPAPAWPPAVGALLAWSAALWATFLGFQAWGGAPEDAPRLAIGLLVGAALAHGGAIALTPAPGASALAQLASPTGFSILFVPLGVLAAGAWPRGTGGRKSVRASVFLAPALGGLCLGLAAARLGCILEGCCGGRFCSAIGHAAPTRWLEALGFVVLAFGSQRVSRRNVVPWVLAGFGALRLATQPFRLSGFAEASFTSIYAMAGAWVCAGLLWAWLQTRRGVFQ